MEKIELIKDKKEREKDRKPIKISKELFIIILIWAVIILMTFIALAAKKISNNYGKNLDYQKIECSPKDISTSGNGKYEFINNYEEYCSLVEKYNYKLTESNEDNQEKVELKYNEHFFDENNLLVIYFFEDGSPIYNTNLVHFAEKENTVKVKISEHSYGVTGDKNEHVFLLPVSKNINNVLLSYPYCDSIDLAFFFKLGIFATILTLVLSVILHILKKDDDWKKRVKKSIILILIIIVLYIIINIPINIYQHMAYKPIIYLYPNEETEVSVELGYTDKITSSYPKYTDGWKVLAKPNGDLIDLNTNRNLYALYYENENTIKFKVEDYGFVIKGEDTAKFLEEKLEILGLNEKEAEEFIIYWLPKLETNKYNYIRFATEDELNANMPLRINPAPDTTIRVLMTYKGLNKKINVEEQKLETPERKGFVAVEWGGTEIK